jgi:hypothetical protein
MEPVGLLDIEMLDEDSGSMPGEEQLVLMEEEKRQRQIDNEAREQLLNSLVQDHEVFLQTLEGTNRSLIEAQWQSTMNAFESDFEMVLSPPDSVEQPTLTLVVPGIPTVRSVLPSPELALLPVTTAGEAQEVPLELPTAHRSETRDGYEAAASSSAHRLASVDVEEPVPMRNSSSDRPSTGASTNRPSFNDFSPSPMRPDPALPDSAMLPDAFESHQSMDHPAMEDDDEIVFISTAPPPTNADVDTRHPAVPAASHPEMHQVDSGSIVLEKRETTLTPRGMTSTEAPDATNMHISGDKPSVVEQNGKVCDTETVATDEEVDTVDHDTASLGASTIQGALIEAAAVESAHSRNGPSPRPVNQLPLRHCIPPTVRGPCRPGLTASPHRSCRPRLPPSRLRSPPASSGRLVRACSVELSKLKRRRNGRPSLASSATSTGALLPSMQYSDMKLWHGLTSLACTLTHSLCCCVRTRPSSCRHSCAFLVRRLLLSSRTSQQSHHRGQQLPKRALHTSDTSCMRTYSFRLSSAMRSSNARRSAWTKQTPRVRYGRGSRNCSCCIPWRSSTLIGCGRKCRKHPLSRWCPCRRRHASLYAIPPSRSCTVATLTHRRHWSSPTPSQRLPRAPGRHRAGHAAPVLTRISWRSRAVSAKSAHPTVLRLVRRRGRAPCPLAARSAPCLRDAHVRPQILARIAPC